MAKATLITDGKESQISVSASLAGEVIVKVAGGYEYEDDFYSSIEALEAMADEAVSDIGDEDTVDLGDDAVKVEVLKLVMGRRIPFKTYIPAADQDAYCAARNWILL